MLLVLASLLSVGLCLPQQPLLGGCMPEDASDPKWTEMLSTLTSNNMIQLPNSYHIVDVCHKTTNGISYNFTLGIGAHICTLVYYEQEWTSTHEITMDTCNIKVHKRAGGYQTQDPTDPKYTLLLQDLDTQGLINLPANGVYNLTGVATQVVAGVNYKFDLLIGGHQCQIIYFEQTWTNTHQITSDTCHGHVRQMGGYHAQDPTDPKYTLLLQDLDTQGLINLPANGVYNLTGVATQVVAGVNYKFDLLIGGHQCQIIYFEQTWTNTHQITSDTCHGHVRQMGGYHAQDPTHHKYTLLLQDLDTQGLINLPANGAYTLTGVATQVVAGVNYKFDLLIGGHQCQIIYFEQTWSNTHQITSDTCHGHVRQMGGYHAQDPTDPKYTLLLQDLGTLGLIKLMSCTLTGVATQVVAGMNYKFDLLCGGHHCQIIYFEQTWTNTHQITSDTCHGHVRQMGGYHAQDPTDPKYTLLLQDLDTQGLINLPANGVYNLTGVATQVVAGMNYKFDLLIGGHQCQIIYFEQTWTNTHKITEDTCHGHVRQLGQFDGGYQTQDPTDPEYQLLLQNLDSQGLVKLPQNGDYQITGVQTQVVSGINYKIDLMVHGHPCQLTIFVQSWTNTQEVSQDSCHIKVTHAVRALDWTTLADTSSTGTQECLGMGLDRVNAMSNSLFRLVDDSITSALQKVHNNDFTEYKLTFTTLPSSCFNNGDSNGMTSAACPANHGHNFQSNTWSVTCSRHASQSPSTQVTDVTMV